MIRDELSIDCTMQDIFNNPTPRGLAQLLTAKAPSKHLIGLEVKPSLNAVEKAVVEDDKVLVEDVFIPLDDVTLAGRLWRPASAEPVAPMTAVVDFAPYPFTFMTATA